MPDTANAVTGVNKAALNHTSSAIKAGMVHATMSALVGTFERGETFDSQRWPGIISSRANEKIKRLAAACRLSTQETNAVTATTKNTFAPKTPSDDSRMPGIGSASSPLTMEMRFGAAST